MESISSGDGDGDPRASTSEYGRAPKRRRLETEEERSVSESEQSPVVASMKDEEGLAQEDDEDSEPLFKIKQIRQKPVQKALVVAQAYLQKDNPNVNWNSIRQGRKIQTLYQDAGVAEGPCGLAEIQKFQEHLLAYQIVVVSAKELNEVVYEGPNREQKLILYLANGHYNVITSITGFTERSYFCVGVTITENATNKIKHKKERDDNDINERISDEHERRREVVTSNDPAVIEEHHRNGRLHRIQLGNGEKVSARETEADMALSQFPKTFGLEDIPHELRIEKEGYSFDFVSDMTKYCITADVLVLERGFLRFRDTFGSATCGITP
ncbi:hypothetical protein Bbelb_361920 [Branchiostoma belcheri]|nr:hypothetical protein Bbelb_361920 [Branchiostoma belcheri]